MRTYLVTGAASGIGKATRELLEQRGHRVIGADLRGTEIECDLSSPAGRKALVDQARDSSGGRLDAVIAVAGMVQPVPTTVAVNYFGMVSTLEGLRPLLEGSPAPRAVGVSSTNSLQPDDPLLVQLMLAGKEGAALERAAELQDDPKRAHMIYSSSKQAFSRWVRRSAPRQDWAGRSIPLNATAPGVVETPMSSAFLSTEEGRQRAFAATPTPLNGPMSKPISQAWALAWLASEENTHLCGQILFVDGGFDAITRADSVW
ncbi:MAG: SDR family oxidoreductase [Bifidobacteriaceae bacterium]|jgi:NAD(P)-dependent dehydrogenase (short-subunit alcohol dehydrogenase family)|nr:SDR family oxidoreductase [Bifidobacteriaceae bacterium]